jgi:hypothetical protein
MEETAESGSWRDDAQGRRERLGAQAAGTVPRWRLGALRSYSEGRGGSGREGELSRRFRTRGLAEQQTAAASATALRPRPRSSAVKGGQAQGR